MLMAMALLTAPAATASDYAQRMQAARDYVESSGMERGLQRRITQIVGTISEQLKQSYPNAEPGKIEQISETVLAEFQSGIPDLLEDAARVYAEHFTSRELREMTRYNRSAVGRKQREKQQVLAQQMGEAFDMWLTQIHYNTLRRMEELLNESGATSGGYGY